MTRPDFEYLDFELRIERMGEGYRAHASCEGIRAHTDFTNPISEIELKDRFHGLGRSRGGTNTLGASDADLVKKLGGNLFEAVFKDGVLRCLDRSRDEKFRQHKGLRIRLNLLEAPDLADLPWEFLYERSKRDFLSLSNRSPIVRYLNLPEAVRPLKVVGPPLRVLVMISNPSDLPALDVQDEWRRLNQALADALEQGLVEVDLLSTPASLAALKRQLDRQRYHVFHFIGHGGFDASLDDGVLALEGEDGRSRMIRSELLGTILNDHDSLGLAVINACEGARSSERDAFSGTAQSLVQKGIPAVIAMQFEITDQAAITFTQEFYTTLAAGFPVDAALAEARKMILAEGNEVEWGTPVLYMRSLDGRIFDFAAEPQNEKPIPLWRRFPLAGKTSVLALTGAVLALALALVLTVVGGIGPGPQPASAPGWLRIGGALPAGAEVLVDGTPVGGYLIPLRAGHSHLVSVTAPGHQPLDSLFHLAADEQRRWLPVLEPIPEQPRNDAPQAEPGQLHITGTLPAGARIFLDGAPIDSGLITLRAGVQYVLRVTASGHAPLDEAFTLGAGEQRTWEPQLRRLETGSGAPSVLRLTSTLPADAQIQVDGRAVRGRTLSLEPGRRRVRIAARGFETLDTIFTLAAGESRPWSPELRPLTREPEPPEPRETSVRRINELVTAYARALEAQDLTAARSFYPGMTQVQRQTWSTQFQGVRGLRVVVSSIGTPEIEGSSARVGFVLGLSYRDSGGAIQNSQSYSAVLIRQPGVGWRFQTIRP